MGSLTGPPCGPLGYLRALSAAASAFASSTARRAPALDGSAAGQLAGPL
jgi:hypothetical protein